MTMFIHAGAGLHGHEYSGRTAHHSSSQPQGQHQHQYHSQQQPTRHHPLLRSALRPLTDINDPRRSTDSNSQTSSQPQSQPPSQPRSALASRRTFSEQIVSPRIPHRPVSDIVSKKDLGVRFQDPPMATAPASITTLPSDDEDSVAGSDVSDRTDTSTRRRRRKRLPRKTTRFALAHPAPQLRTKQRRLIQIRPRLLLQLQHIDGRRPTPAFDVVPSSLVAGSLIIPRLAKKFPRIIGARPELGHDDLLLVRSEDYQNEDHSEGAIDDRELMAIVCPIMHPDEPDAEIITADGSTWRTSHMANGSYEFTRVDSQGVTPTARWVRKMVRPTKQGQDSPEASPATSPSLPENRWTFSVIDPSTRRHPIMGVLTSQELIMYDSYSTMSASSGRYPPTRPFSANLSGSDASVSASTVDERATVTVPEEYRQLMAVTASWISLRQAGWPATSKPKMGRTSMHSRSVSSSSFADRRRTFPLSDTKSQLITQIGAERDDPVTTTPLQAGFPKRNKSTGSTFFRRRRPDSALVEGGVEDTSPVFTADRVVRGTEDSDEKTHTCRVRVKRWTQKLFHRKRVAAVQ